MIDNTFIQSPEYQDYLDNKKQISPESVVFVEDKERLITQGKEYLFVPSNIDLEELQNKVENNQGITWGKVDYPRVKISSKYGEEIFAINIFLKYGDIFYNMLPLELTFKYSGYVTIVPDADNGQANEMFKFLDCKLSDDNIFDAEDYGNRGRIIEGTNLVLLGTPDFTTLYFGNGIGNTYYHRDNIGRYPLLSNGDIDRSNFSYYTELYSYDLLGIRENGDQNDISDKLCKITNNLNINFNATETITIKFEKA